MKPNRLNRLICGLILGLSLSASAIHAAPPELALALAPEIAPSTETAEAGINAFACDLYAQLKKQGGNLFFSPLSISYALAVTGAGARGETLAQMERVLHAPLGKQHDHAAFSKLMQRLNTAQSDEQVRMVIANSLWPDKSLSIRPEYEETARNYYGAPITPVNYKDGQNAAKQINAWVEQKTRDRIRDLLSPGDLNASTRLVLVNAVYFNGRWLSPFDSGNTRTAVFHAPGKQVDTRFMFQKKVFRYGQVENLQILELPYKGEGFSMLALLPEDKPGALEKLEGALSPESLAQWTTALTRQEVNVLFPKFKLTWGARELNGELIALGMRNAFGSADFSGISPENPFISKVVHKADVEVDEGGTVAAAATGVMMSKSAVARPIPEFRADRPFLFLIRENSKGTILFMGRLTEPR
ncbi:MAG: serpin family protein [Betaproteobacteria bacterium]|nr:serpin family protein [Betaproteobacteria bacterium]